MANFEITNPIYLVNKASSVDSLYGTYPSLQSAIDALTSLALPGRQFAVQETGQPVKLYIWQGVGVEPTLAGSIDSLKIDNTLFFDEENRLSINSSYFTEETILDNVKTLVFPLTVTTTDSYYSFEEVYFNGGLIPSKYYVVTSNKSIKLLELPPYVQTDLEENIITIKGYKYIKN